MLHPLDPSPFARVTPSAECLPTQLRDSWVARHGSLHGWGGISAASHAATPARLTPERALGQRIFNVTVDATTACSAYHGQRA